MRTTSKVVPAGSPVTSSVSARREVAAVAGRVRRVGTIFPACVNHSSIVTVPGGAPGRVSPGAGVPGPSAAVPDVLDGTGPDGVPAGPGVVPGLVGFAAVGAGPSVTERPPEHPAAARRTDTSRATKSFTIGPLLRYLAPHGPRRRPRWLHRPVTVA